MRKQRGFTLIELVIAVAMVAILAAIALPKNALVDLAARQERFRFNNNRYASNLADLGVSSSSPEGHYTIEITAADVNAFSARVTPGGAQVNDKCNILTINNAGLKGTTNSHGRTAEDCWR
jgi:type IV pilus assembly protein PilE